MAKGSSRMDKQNTGDASNSKGTVRMTVLQHFMKKEAELKELKKQIEALKLQDEELKAREKNLDPKAVRVMNGDTEGIGLEDLKNFQEELKNFQDMLVEIQSMSNNQLN